MMPPKRQQAMPTWLQCQSVVPGGEVLTWCGAKEEPTLSLGAILAAKVTPIGAEMCTLTSRKLPHHCKSMRAALVGASVQ